tara:strand:+ start:362 stop:604 length:243 start_codon:yes stop_codon:yes gene_type:complete
LIEFVRPIFVSGLGFAQMKLKQGQIWKKDDKYYRITEWARMTIRYKMSYSLHGPEESVEEVSKKEFCRLLKGAELCEETD